MIYDIITIFLFVAILFFMASIFYTHYINKKLDNKKEECYNKENDN